MTNGQTGAPTLLLYLHGFRSSPQSFKAVRMQAWLQSHRPDVAWWCPALPHAPAQAWTLVEQGLAERAPARLAVVGSSLGGYYATAVAERTGCRAVMLNPAVDPARDLRAHLGPQTGYHDPAQQFELLPVHLQQLRQLALPVPLTRPERYLAVIAKGDEVLDWREMTARYAAAHLRLIEGSDHGLGDFDLHLPTILRFLHLAD